MRSKAYIVIDGEIKVETVAAVFAPLVAVWTGLALAPAVVLFPSFRLLLLVRPQQLLDLFHVSSLNWLPPKLQFSMSVLCLSQGWNG